ncbi:hypothetical protein F0562_016427 [Nyssa sinensis]|uniref:Uncharacterized protein n=1 Tax=Nyssa sinensis TaxID=561372 RepID=A0A5J4ZLD0_9ASTE|nr:hypothetical protein F0562_016427 [Nyssa sinensis]
MSSKFSSSISPASSISDWSSESSSSVSTVNQRSNKLRISLDSSSSCRSVESDIPLLDLQKHSNDQISDGGENQVTGSTSQNVKKATTQIGSLAAPTKPSGLRMPSPKIGFFDGVKSLVRTPNGGMQSHSGLSTGLPEVGSGICSPSGDSSKPKLGKLQSAATVSAIGVPNASTRISSAPRGVKNSPRISPKVPNKTSRESGSSIKADKQSSEMQGNADLKDINITSIEQDICDSTSVSNIENVNSSQKVSEYANYGQHHLKDNFHLLVDNIENEKTYFEDQVDGLSKCVGALDQKSEIQKEHIDEFISRVDVCSQDSGAFDLSCFGQLIVHDQKEGTNLSNPSLLSVSPTILEVTAGTRTPFAVKNSFCNSEGLIFSTGLSLEAHIFLQDDIPFELLPKDENQVQNINLEVGAELENFLYGTSHLQYLSEQALQGEHMLLEMGCTGTRQEYSGNMYFMDLFVSSKVGVHRYKAVVLWKHVFYGLFVSSKDGVHTRQ